MDSGLVRSLLGHALPLLTSYARHRCTCLHDDNHSRGPIQCLSKSQICLGRSTGEIHRILTAQRSQHTRCLPKTLDHPLLHRLGRYLRSCHITIHRLVPPINIETQSHTNPTTAPFELIKNATQTSVLMSTGIGSHRGPTIGSVAPDKGGRVSSWDAFKQIVRNRGYLGLYTGFRLHLLRDTVGTGIYFGVYETTKASIKTYQGAEEANTNSAIAIAGFVTGVMSWGIVSTNTPQPPPPSKPPYSPPH